METESSPARSGVHGWTKSSGCCGHTTRKSPSLFLNCVCCERWAIFLHKHSHTATNSHTHTHIHTHTHARARTHSLSLNTRNFIAPDFENRIKKKALNPSTEQTFTELRKSEGVRQTLEDELVKSDMRADKLASELAVLKRRVQDLESERGFVDQHWSDKLDAAVARTASNVATASASTSASASGATWSVASSGR